jgi:glycosyltransferase involved in cell wall biosynthesis
MASQNPKVSIIVPVYNAEKYIEETLQSILNQDFKDFELIVIDDASTDNSFKKIKEISKKDQRIKIFKNKTNKGRAGTVNVGFSQSKGEFIAFCDADDLMYPERLKKQFSFLKKNSEIDLIYGNIIKFWPNNIEKLRKAATFKNSSEPLNILKQESKKNKNYKHASSILHSKDYIPGSSIIFRKKIIDQGIKMDENLKNSEDCDFNFQIIGAGYKIAKIPIVTFKYRIHKNQKSNNKSKMEKAKKYIIKKLKLGKYFKD